MSTFREQQDIEDCCRHVAQSLLSAVANDPNAPIHMPHAVGYWAINHMRAIQESIILSHEKSVAEGVHDEEACYAEQAQSHMEGAVLAFLAGVEYATRGHKVTPCDCGKLPADNLEELLNGTWRNPPRH